MLIVFLILVRLGLKVFDNQRLPLIIIFEYLISRRRHRKHLIYRLLHIFHLIIIEISNLTNQLSEIVLIIASQNFLKLHVSLLNLLDCERSWLRLFDRGWRWRWWRMARRLALRLKLFQKSFKGIIQSYYHHFLMVNEDLREVIVLQRICTVSNQICWVSCLVFNSTYG